MSNGGAASARDTRFVVSVDTEEDNWGWAHSGPITCRNIHELPRLARFFERTGVRPTFFVTHAVLSDPSSRDIIRELGSEPWLEIGAHVHPWNTPPLDASVPRRTMLYEYPPGLQGEKIAAVTDLLGEVVGRRPTSFRAGRFGFGAATAPLLLKEGYLVDSSVTPYWDWRGSSHGPSYVDAPLGIYRIKGGLDVLIPHPAGELIEVPLTSGFSRMEVGSWRLLARYLDGPVARTAHLGGLASRLAGLRRVILSPEIYTVGEMMALSERVIRGGVGHLHLFFHSSSLRPGLTPFTTTGADVDRLYDRMERLLETLEQSQQLGFATVGEAAILCDVAPAASPEPGLRGSSEATTTGTVATGPLKGIHSLRQYGGTKVTLGFLARYALWTVGRYRRYRKVRWSGVKRLVFVCSGNICRSAYAEHWAKAQGLPSVSIGVDTVDGNPANASAMKAARLRGIQMDEHRTTRIEDFEARDGDLFVAMEPFHARVVERQKQWGVDHQVTLLGLWIDAHGAVVLDPFGGSDECFSHCLSLIESGVGAINAQVAGTSGVVADP